MGSRCRPEAPCCCCSERRTVTRAVRRPRHVRHPPRQHQPLHLRQGPALLPRGESCPPRGTSRPRRTSQSLAGVGHRQRQRAARADIDRPRLGTLAHRRGLKKALFETVGIGASWAHEQDHSSFDGHGGRSCPDRRDVDRDVGNRLGAAPELSERTVVGSGDQQLQESSADELRTRRILESDIQRLSAARPGLGLGW